MNTWIVAFGAAGLIGLVVTVIVVACKRFDSLLDPTEEDDFCE